MGASDEVHKVGCSLFFMKHKKMVARCNYHKTSCPLVLPLPCHPTASMEEQQLAKGRGQGLLGIQGTFPLWSSRHLLFLPPKQKPPGGVAESHPSCWGQHRVHLLFLHPVLCLVVWCWLPRAMSSPSTLGPGSACSLGSWEDHNSCLMLLCSILFNIKIFPS